eukprot:3954011-Amphidinium_carterae.1
MSLRGLRAKSIVGHEPDMCATRQQEINSHKRTKTAWITSGYLRVTRPCGPRAPSRGMAEESARQLGARLVDIQPLTVRSLMQPCTYAGVAEYGLGRWKHANLCMHSYVAIWLPVALSQEAFSPSHPTNYSHHGMLSSLSLSCHPFSGSAVLG